MITNNLKIASRNLWRRMIFSSIDIMGLAVSMTASFLILLCVRFELNKDSFQSKDRILVATAILATLAALYTICFWIIKGGRSASRKITAKNNKSYKLIAHN